LRDKPQSPPAGRTPQPGGGKRPARGEAPPDPLTLAFRLLSRRAYSIAEMRRALARKYPQPEEVSAAIARLRELGYLDDRKFAEQYAHSLAQNRKFGPHRLRRELKARLVDYGQIEPAVEQVQQEMPPRELLEQALAKKLRTTRLPLTRARLHSLCQGLLRLGFGVGDIIKVVRSRPELKPVADALEPVDVEISGEDPGAGLS